MEVSYLNERYYQEDIPFDSITDDTIVSIFYRDDGSIKGTYASEAWLSRRPNLNKYLHTRYSDAEDSSIREILYRIKNNIEERPICPVCKKNYIKFNSMSKYNTTCSPKCHRILKNDEIFATNIRKYGSTNPLNDPKIKAKQIQTNIKKYGAANPFASDLIKQKITQTNREKYGTDYYSQSDTYKEYWKNNVVPRLGEIERQKYETHKKNKSFNISGPELKLFELLKNRFGENNVIHQYSSDDYPFSCDFYIVPLDLYIEYNGNWTHGKHPFDKNNDKDVERLNYLIEQGKEKKYYTVAAYVWSRNDVKKRTWAKEHNINFIEFWSLNEAINWINTYEEN